MPDDQAQKNLRCDRLGAFLALLAVALLGILLVGLLNLLGDLIGGGI